jgi:hypothetical protein
MGRVEVMTFPVPESKLLNITGISSKIEKYRRICGTIKWILNKNRALVVLV